MEHEDDLINNRLNWNFTIQGFLFLSWAYCFQKLVDLKIGLACRGSNCPDQATIDKTIQVTREAMEYISFAGIAVSLLIFLGAWGAQLAIWRLHSKWLKEHPEYKDDLRRQTRDEKENEKAILPGLCGGGSKLAFLLGLAPPISIPIVLICIWLVMIFKI